MIFKNLNIAIHKQETIIESTGEYRGYFLLTMKDTPEFKTFLKACEKPVYAIELEKTNYYIESIYRELNTIYEERNNLLCIPFHSFRAIKKTYNDVDQQVYLSHKMKVKTAMLYSNDNPEGFIDPAVLKEPMSYLLKNRTIYMNKKVAGILEITDALWKTRNNVCLVNESFLSNNDDCVAERYKELRAK